VPGRGHAGARGGPAGDLYVTIEVGEHRVFRRSGRDVHVTVPITVAEAGLGAKIEVPTLDGPVTVRVPPGATSGQHLRLRGRGVGPLGDQGDLRGDLVIETQIALPSALDEASKDLLREFGRRNPADVRRHLFD
jgi:molecular chaperone DnaJ